jgi:hypothetical protein
LRFFNLLFGLDSPVEDRTVATLAKNFLMQTALTTLALDPQVAVLLLKKLEFLLALNVNVLHATVAAAAHNFLISTEQVLAAKTRFLNFSKFEQTQVCVAHRWLEYVAHVVT